MSSGARAYLVMREQLKWYDKDDSSPWIDALAELRQRAAREGHCFQHVQAITVAIDQYAEKALGNRDYFLNKSPTLWDRALPNAATPAVATRPVVAVLAAGLAVCHSQGGIRRDIAYGLIACENPAGINCHQGAAGAGRREIVIVHRGWAVI